MLKIAIVIVLVAGRAAAQTPSEAETLFREGLALLEAGKPAEACERFERSILKDPRAIGVLMNLGRCNERAGRSRPRSSATRRRSIARPRRSSRRRSSSRSRRSRSSHRACPCFASGERPRSPASSSSSASA
jgi:predicted Zn-dependent protease